ncbi:MAG: PilC/PilY family type IV pilus protein [Alcanivoracaceae bacterium]|jgi:type IV pilus assembly protein PilY1|nr:PilC/PilY family type IV pilus protein [Alcanivoracaceae bacterium]
MKTIRELGKASLIALAVMLSPTTVYADDTEIFFSAAQADNDENKPIANVFIMLDTSGSMRYCENSLGTSGYDANWCSDASERRINILQSALKDMLEDVPDGVRLGLGRFNLRINDIWDKNSGVGQQGGRVLVPVTDVTEGSKAVMLQEIAKLNDAGNNASGSYPAAQPAGDTPTGRAYSEAARYMMGMAPKYGTAQNGAQSSVCLETATREVGCRDVYIGKEDPEEVAFCDTANDILCTSEIAPIEDEVVVAWCDTSRDACRVERGGWTNVANGGTCDLSDPESCRRLSQWTNMGFGETCNTYYSDCRRWSNWEVTRTRSSGANNSNCPAINRSWWSNNNYYQERDKKRCYEGRRYYQQVQYTYQTREVTYFERPETYYQWEAIYEKQCDLEEYCLKEEPIISGGKYVSPINLNNQCESNHVILFTDGTPSSNDFPGNQGFVDCGSDGSYSCQIKISKYLHSDNNAKKRKVKTYNIGLYMGSNRSNMEDVSTDGKKGTINADNSEQLVKAFADIVNLIADNSRSFSAPGVAVNQMNRLEHLDQLYYAVFEPKKSSYWEGNLKRYRVVDDQIRATNGPAVDPTTGFFSENAKSFWSASVDGADVRKGGAREKVASRRLFYSDEFGATKQLDWLNDNTPTFYGLPTTATTEQVTELKDMLKVSWGDPLHSEPVLVNYGGSSDNNRIFVSGNDGMLRAINSQTGTEVWAFMPNEMIRKANKFTVNRPGLALNNDRQIYGMDGSWTAWRRPGASASSAPSKVYVYGGMRRGGTSYYAIDATGSSPKLVWQIDRGDTGFERLGQTWSQPTLTQVKVGGVKRPALVFGGGYDPAGHDGKQDAGRSGGDSMGNAIYVVDAVSGQLLWSAGANNTMTSVAAMKWSVPSTISVVDANFDGAADFFYFGDLGGQLFRVDLDDANVTNSKVRRLADLSGTGVTNNRRFYYAPSISYVRSEDGTQEDFYISMGSGYRTHPLSENTEDYFFVIRDDGISRDASNKFVGSAPTSLLTAASLDTLSGSGAADPDKAGWKLPLEGDGEKSLSASVVFNNRIFFTTYQPTSEDDSLDGNDCAVRIGTTFLYVVDLVTGQGASINNDGELGGDRRKELAQDVPPPSPTLLSDGEKVLVIIGTEVAGGESLGNTGVRRGSWYQLEMDEPDKVPGPNATPKQP